MAEPADGNLDVKRQAGLTTVLQESDGVLIIVKSHRPEANTDWWKVRGRPINLQLASLKWCDNIYLAAATKNREPQLNL